MALTDYSIDTSADGLDPKTIERKRLLAEALSKQGSNYSPIQSPWQGLARVGDALLGGLQERKLDQQDRANKQSGQSVSDAYVKSLMGNSATQGSVPASLGAAQPPTADAAASGIASDAPKIYSQDQLNPMDEPRGSDRTKMIATLLGEERAGSPESLGAANVIRNRAVDGGYGGDTPDAVVQSPNQFSPWNDQAGRARMARALQDPAQVAKANDTIDQTYGVGKYASAGPNDPTEGKTHFYDPASMVPPNSVPKWAQGKEGQQIGKTLFFDDPNEPTPPNAQMAQGQLPQQVMSAAGQPDVNAQRRSALAAALDPNVPATTRAIAKSDYDRLSKPDTLMNAGGGKLYNQRTGQWITAPETEEDAGKIRPVTPGGALVHMKDGKVVVDYKNETPHDATIDDKTSQAMADQYLAGDRTVLQNLGRGAQGAANIVKLRQTIQQRAEDAGVDPKGIVNNFNEQAGALAGQRAVGTRAANISLAANEANNMIPIALDASAKLPRTQWMPWNQMVQAAQKGSSSPELASFVAATNSLVNSYVRAVSPSGVPTDSMRQHAYDMLNAAQGPQAYKSVVSTMQLEMKAALSAPAQVRKELRKGNEPEAETAPAAPAAKPAAPEPPKVGDEVKGHKFLGGDPSNPASWAKVDKT